MKKQVGTIDITPPNWRGILPTLFTLYDNISDEENRAVVMREFYRMADLADRRVETIKAVPKTGAILGIMPHSPGNFIILVRITGALAIAVDQAIAHHKGQMNPKTGKPMYSHVWFAPIEVPKDED